MVGSPGTGYHQDYSYQPFDRKGSMTFWIALVDMTPEMGPLRYLRGSHREGPLGLSGRQDIRDTYPQLREAEVVGGQALKAGDAQAHWELTVHGAAPNQAFFSLSDFTALLGNTNFSRIGNQTFDATLLGGGAGSSQAYSLIFNTNFSVSQTAQFTVGLGSSFVAFAMSS